MSTLLPTRPELEDDDREPALVGLADDEAECVFEALASRTARRIIARLYDGPATASEIAESVDTSLQNATYHLSRLREADLVAVAGTWYSSRGVEMTVYTPTSEPLLLVAGTGYTEEIADDIADVTRDDSPRTDPNPEPAEADGEDRCR